MLDKQFFGDTQFHAFLNEKFIVFHAVRGQEEGDKIYKKFNIRATPTVLIADVDGSEIDRQVGYGPPATKFKNRLVHSLTGEDTFAKLKKRYKQNPNDLLTTFKLARKYENMFDPVKVNEFISKVLSRAEEAKKLTVNNPRFDKDVNMYEWARFIKAGQNRGDVSELIQFSKDFPESDFKMDALMRIGSFYAYIGGSKEAESFFTESMKKYPDNKSLKSYYIEYCTRTHSNLDQAGKIAEEMIKGELLPDPYNVASYARLLEAKEDYDKLDELYSKDNIESKNGIYAYGLYNYANYWNEQEDNLESAEQMIKLALKLAPTRTYYRSLAADICLKNNKPDEADRLFGPEFIAGRKDKQADVSSYISFWAKQGKHLQSALELAKSYHEKSKSPYARQLLAEVYLASGEDDKALDVYGPAFLKENDENVNIFNSYAWFWAGKGKNLKSALKAIDKLLEKSPGHYALDTKSLVLMKMGQYEQAIKVEEEALKLSPKNANYLKRIEEIKKEMKRSGKSVSQNR